MSKNRFSRTSSTIDPNTLSQGLMRRVEFTFEPRTRYVEGVLRVLLESRFGWDIAEPVTIDQTRDTALDPTPIHDQCVLCVENFSGTRIVSYCASPSDHLCNLCPFVVNHPQGRAEFKRGKRKGRRDTNLSSVEFEKWSSLSDLSGRRVGKSLGRALVPQLDTG